MAKLCSVIVLLSALAATEAAPPRPAVQSLATGLVAHWPLDAIAGGTTTPDASSSSPTNTATLNGGPTIVAGRNGNGLVFNQASNQFLSVPDAPALQFGASSFSVSVWAMPSNLSTKRRVVNKWDDAGYGWLLDFNSEAAGGDLPGAIRFRINDTSNNNTSLVTAGGVLTSTTTFVHVAAVADRSTGLLHLYLNGAEIAPSPIAITGTPDVSMPGITLGIGTIVNGPNNFYSGVLDDVRLYNRALTPEEILALATFTGPPTAATNLAAATPPWNRVDLTWTPGSEVGAYDVERSLQGMNAWARLTPAGIPSSSTRYSDPTVTAGTAYDYRVVSVNPYGTATSSPVTAIPPVPPPRTKSKDDGKCGCGIVDGAPLGWSLLALAAGVGVLLRSRSGRAG
jgi:hypothetical protein